MRATAASRTPASLRCGRPIEATSSGEAGSAASWDGDGESGGKVRLWLSLPKLSSKSKNVFFTLQPCGKLYTDFCEERSDTSLHQLEQFDLGVDAPLLSPEDSVE